MLRLFRADLHVHTCLSPCASLDMGPRAIVRRAAELGLGMVAIADHNSCENAGAAMKAGRRWGVRILPGMEVTSREEVHILGLFDELDETFDLQQMVYDQLPGWPRQEVFGSQVVLNEADEVLGFNDRPLGAATGLSVEQVVRSIHALGGVAVAAHVDRESFGLIGHLGFVPEGLDLDAVEVSPRLTTREARRRFPQIAGYPLIRSSDAHELEQVGGTCTTFRLREPTLAEMRKAFQGVGGREILPSDGPAPEPCGGRPQRP